MIVSSLLLLVTGAVLLIAGLIGDNDSLLVGTIVASLVAAACVFTVNRGSAGQRRRSRQRHDGLEQDVDARARRHGQQIDADIPRRGSRSDRVDIEVNTDGVPSDEPSEAPMSSVEAAALMRMDTEVMVIDGRPRFHLGGCVHLIGRESEPLPAYEAVELGFTPCSLCRPAQSFLQEPLRR